MSDPGNDNVKRCIFLIIAICALVTIGVTAESKYENVTADRGDGCGILEIETLCHHNLFSKEVIINGNQSVFMQPDGTFDMRLLPGEYELELVDGNGAHPEYRSANVTAGELTLVTFIGHAVSGNGNIEPTVIPTVEPTIVPTVSPTIAPTPIPTTIPTVVPTTIPTVVPTIRPTPEPTKWCRWVCDLEIDFWNVSCRPNCRWVCT